VVAGWGAYLVPFWVHRHDGPAAEMRSIQGFSTAMRTLSRRKPGYVDGRYVVMPGGPQRASMPQSVHVSGAGVRRAVDHHLARRRQALLSLLVTSTVSLPIAIFVGGLTRLLFVLSVVSTVAYACMLRRETVRSQQRRRRARQLARRRQLEADRSAYLAQVAADSTPRPRQAPAIRYVPEQQDGEFKYLDTDWQRVVGQ